MNISFAEVSVKNVADRLINIYHEFDQHGRPTPEAMDSALSEFMEELEVLQNSESAFDLEPVQVTKYVRRAQGLRNAIASEHLESVMTGAGVGTLNTHARERSEYDRSEYTILYIVKKHYMLLIEEVILDLKGSSKDMVKPIRW